MNRGRERMFWAKSVGNVQHGMFSALNDTTSKFVISTMSGDHESTSMKVDEHRSRLFRFRPIEVHFDGSSRVAAWQMKNLIWFGINVARFPPEDKADEQRRHLKTKITQHDADYLAKLRRFHSDERAY